MKCKALFFTLVLPAFLCAQNLVPNWSFEEYEDCPDGISQIDRATGWMSFRLTPDYFNSCAEPGVVGIPNNFMTSGQLALHGEAYGGFGQVSVPAGNSELLGIELQQPLSIGELYYLSFYIVRGFPNSSNCWANKMGAQLAMQAYSDWPNDVTMPISNSPHVYTEEMVTDTVNWTKIEGYFIADSAYSYLAIGNHFSPDSIETGCYGEYSNYQAYYFVDCVCLAMDPQVCPECSTITTDDSRVNIKEIRIFPNPFTDQLAISFGSNQMDRKYIRLFDKSGRLIYEDSFIDDNIRLNKIGLISKGFYVLRVDFENGESQKFKLIKF